MLVLWKLCNCSGIKPSAKRALDHHHFSELIHSYVASASEHDNSICSDIIAHSQRTGLFHKLGSKWLPAVNRNAPGTLHFYMFRFPAQEIDFFFLWFQIFIQRNKVRPFKLLLYICFYIVTKWSKFLAKAKEYFRSAWVDIKLNESSLLKEIELHNHNFIRAFQLV